MCVCQCNRKLIENRPTCTLLPAFAVSNELKWTYGDTFLLLKELLDLGNGVGGLDIDGHFLTFSSGQVAKRAKFMASESARSLETERRGLNEPQEGKNRETKAELKRFLSYRS